MKRNFNVDINGTVVTDVAEKIGAIFGDKGQEVGRSIDNLTKNITIKVDTVDGGINKHKNNSNMEGR